MLEKLLTEMSDEELTEHLRKLRKVHAVGAQTKIRTINKDGEVKQSSVNKALKNLTPEKIQALATLLAGAKK